tara:strand:- start:615 stop:803 length:189 start_codon:yes stop_codon:yes gene_type:complete
MNKVFDLLGGRKMALAIILFIIATVLLFIGKADFSSWGEFIKWIFGIYAVGNGAEHIAKRKS